ncbi:P-loop containing nucleoside triphosphate hydrolase protein [Elsinoe ampelina]|uniref:RNA helicase n=1 Tax=Elsinoe ampelina TaxID=302913 RepID=A0A6A6GCP2_9PEZI|nr:P-loop containing nucleoside triphosphate hydrolase protein [Elsinoe ampelina]
MSKDTSEANGDTTPKLSKRSWQALTPSLSEWILDAISSMGFHQMTPVQASTIPLFMGNKDVVVEAVTGSGKTLSFLLPVVEKLLRQEDQPKRHHIGAIIVSPTRELASQIYSVLISLLAFHGPSAAHLPKDHDTDTMEEDEPSSKPASIAPKIIPQLLLGGTTPPAADLAHFLNHSPNFIIATPGRLLELLSSSHVHCSQSTFSTLVLDEADRLLDLGFSDTLRKILTRLPKQRRTGLFSASMSEALDQLIRVGLRNPVKVVVRVRSKTGEQKTPSALNITYLTTPASHKITTLLHLLNSISPPPLKTLIYLSTCHSVDYWSIVLPALLSSTPYNLIPLHGKLPPAVRARNFTAFTSSSTPTLLLTTDVAARGLDIPQVDLVLQLDPPSDPKTFVHRCGRAGRAGRRGTAIVFLEPQEQEKGYIEFLRLRGTPATAYPLPLPSAEEAAATTTHIRTLVARDRATHDRAQRAFVSWVRSYGKHAAKSIFDLRDADWASLAEGWGLLRLPRMPESKNWKGDWRLGRANFLAAVKYKDKEREKRRLEELSLTDAERAGKRQEKETEEGRQERAWTRQKEMKKTREERREKRGEKRERERKKGLTEEERRAEEETERLVGEVRRRNAEAWVEGKGMQTGGGEEEEGWEGFDD